MSHPTNSLEQRTGQLVSAFNPLQQPLPAPSDRLQNIEQLEDEFNNMGTSTIATAATDQATENASICSCFITYLTAIPSRIGIFLQDVFSWFMSFFTPNFFSPSLQETTPILTTPIIDLNAPLSQEERRAVLHFIQGKKEGGFLGNKEDQEAIDAVLAAFDRLPSKAKTAFLDHRRETTDETFRSLIASMPRTAFDVTEKFLAEWTETQPASP